MSSAELRKAFLDYFAKQRHTIVPSSSLVPENDSSTLFTGSGMQPLLPYLLGTPHPAGKRLANSQKCFRAEDITEVGDNRHTTFFEMLGNWSLGDYFKEEQLPWFFAFLTDVVGLDPQQLYVTCFVGDEKNKIPKDTESAEIWKRLFREKGIEAKEVELLTEVRGAELGMQEGRIFYYDSKKNWWSRAGAPESMPIGEPGGPDSEVFFDFGTPHKKEFGENCHPNCDCGRFLEIGNSVFMEYQKQADGTFAKLSQRNVDFGGGLERMVAAKNSDPDIFKIDVLWPLIGELEKISGMKYETEYQKSFRIIADHVRGACFMIADGVIPSNKEQGYLLRRLIRRLLIEIKKLNIPDIKILDLLDITVDIYKESYVELKQKKGVITELFSEENKRFEEIYIRTLNDKALSLRKQIMELFKAGKMSELVTQIDNLEKEKQRKGLQVKPIHGGVIDAQHITYEQLVESTRILGKEAFDLHQSTGARIELIEEIAKSFGLKVDREGFEREFKKHQKISGAGREHKFGGHGLILDTGELKAATEEEVEIVTRLHTATHLLQSSLRKVLGESVHQAGSDITAERTRFDFTFDRKLTPEEIKEVEELVNKAIQDDLTVEHEEMPYERAMETGALHFAKEKYPPQVKVYTMDSKYPEPFSKELCGGPHVEHTLQVGRFRIIKEEGVAAGVRRIRGTVE